MPFGPPDLNAEAAAVWGYSPRTLTQSLPSGTDYTTARAGYLDLLTMAIASNNIKYSALTERATTSTIFVVMKSFMLAIFGQVRLIFDIKNASNSTTYAEVRVNGAAVASYTSSVNSYQTKTVDINGLQPGDIIEIALYTNNSSNAAYIKNAKIAYDLNNLGRVIQD